MDMHLALDDSPPLVPRKSPTAAFRSMSKGSRHVTDTETFYTELYLYYQAKGLSNFVAKRVVSLATTTFIVLFCSFIFSFVKWHDLLTCPDHSVSYYGFDGVNHAKHANHTNGTVGHEPCGPLASYINWKAWKSPDGWHVMVIGNMVIMCLYWLWGLLSTIPMVWSAARVHTYLKNELKVSTRRLQTMEWEELLDLHSAYQQLGPLRGVRSLPSSSRDALLKEPAIVGAITGAIAGAIAGAPPGDDTKIQQISDAALERWHAQVAARIMKRDNYMIAIVRERVIPLAVCGVELPFSQSLYWLTQAIVSAAPPDRIHKTQIRRASISLGVVTLLLLPFAFIFLLTFFLIKHAEEFHVNRDYLGPRTWSLYARTLFRKYNELPHTFHNRILGSHKPAIEYIRQFYLPVEHTLGQFFSFVFSALLTVMALMALFDESIMLHVTVGSRNLLFYLAIFSFGIAGAHCFIPDPNLLPYNPTAKMEILQTYIRYCPDDWKGRYHTFEVRDQVMTLFQLRIREFFYEMLTALFLPYILLWVIPRKADSISRFLRSHTTSDERGTKLLSSSVEWAEI